MVCKGWASWCPSAASGKPVQYLKQEFACRPGGMPGTFKTGESMNKHAKLAALAAAVFAAAPGLAAPPPPAPPPGPPKAVQSESPAPLMPESIAAGDASRQ